MNFLRTLKNLYFTLQESKDIRKNQSILTENYANRKNYMPVPETSEVIGLAFSSCSRIFYEKQQFQKNRSELKHFVTEKVNKLQQHKIHHLESLS